MKRKKTTMDFSKRIGALGVGSSEPASKARIVDSKAPRGESKEDKEDRQRLADWQQCMSKLILSLAMQCRMNECILMLCFQLPTDCIVITSAQESTRKWDGTRKALIDKGVDAQIIRTELGPPNCSILAGWSELVVNWVATNKPEALEWIKALFASLTWEILQDTFPVIRVRKMFSSIQLKVVVLGP